MTKQQKEERKKLIERIENVTGYSFTWYNATCYDVGRTLKCNGMGLYNYYDRPSHYKINAYEWCEGLRYKLYNYLTKDTKSSIKLIYSGVTGANCMQFTYSIMIDELKEDGTILEHYFKITKDHNYYCLIGIGEQNEI